MGRSGHGRQAAVQEERFEVRLSGGDLLQARKNMAATEMRKKSDFVRMMLTRIDLRPQEGIGDLCLQVNELIFQLEEHGVDAGTASAVEDIRKQLRLLVLADAGLRPGRWG